MIPSQQSMMLETALALEQVIKNPRAAVSKAGKVGNSLSVGFHPKIMGVCQNAIEISYVCDNSHLTE